MDSFIMKFGDFIREHPNCLNNAITLKGYLLDNFPGESLKIRLLMHAYESGILNIIQKNSKPDIEVLNRLLDRLANVYGITEDNAYWAIDTWLIAMGKKKPKKKYIADITDVERRQGKFIDCKNEVNDSKNNSMKVVYEIAEKILDARLEKGNEAYPSTLYSSNSKKYNSSSSTRVVYEDPFLRKNGMGSFEAQRTGVPCGDYNIDITWLIKCIAPNMPITKENIYELYQNDPNAHEVLEEYLKDPKNIKIVY